MQKKYKYHVFISHAEEDKKDIGNPLCKSLRKAGIKVWYSGSNHHSGSRLNKTIMNAIAKSRFGIIIISKDYFISSWGKRELNKLHSLETPRKTIIIPIWHKVSEDEVRLVFRFLHDRFALKSDRGIRYLTTEIKRVVQEEEKRRNSDEESNPDGPKKRIKWTAVIAILITTAVLFLLFQYLHDM